MCEATPSYSVKDYLEDLAHRFQGQFEQRQLESVCLFDTPQCLGSIRGIQLGAGLSLLFNQLCLPEKLNYTQAHVRGYIKISFYKKANFQVNNSQGYSVLSGALLKIDFFDEDEEVTVQPLSNSFESIDLVIRKGMLRNLLGDSFAFPNILEQELRELIQSSRGHRIFAIPENLHAIIDELWNSKGQGIFQLLDLQSKSYQLLKELLSFLRENQTTENSRKNYFQALEKAKDILKLQYCTPPTIRQLSREVGLNEHKLKKCFKECYNCTIYQYVNSVRMKNSKEMLLSGNYNINEVADQIGYNNTSKFISAFKREFGITPGKFKSQVA